jgi:hypothetical protein
MRQWPSRHRSAADFLAWSNRSKQFAEYSGCAGAKEICGAQDLKRRDLAGSLVIRRLGLACFRARSIEKKRVSILRADYVEIFASGSVAIFLKINPFDARAGATMITRS